VARFSIQKKSKFTAFAEKRNQHTQVLWILRSQDLRILATHLKGPEKEDVLQTSLMQECFNSLDHEGGPRGFAKASKSEAWMDSMREELSTTSKVAWLQKEIDTFAPVGDKVISHSSFLLP